MAAARFDSLAGADGIASAYNSFGELTSSTIDMSGLGKTIAYAYNKQGLRPELTHADGQKFTYTRDLLGRVTNIYEGTTPTASNQLIQNSFDSRGLIDWM